MSHVAVEWIIGTADRQQNLVPEITSQRGVRATKHMLAAKLAVLNASHCSYLSESNVLGVLPKALPADVQVVLTDDSPFVATYSAAG